MSNFPNLRRATWLHPLRGIYYFARHPFLWPLFRGRLVPIVFLSGFIYTILFVFTYLPQVAFLAIFQGKGAWVNGAFLVLGEGAVMVALLFEAFFVDETLVDVFDAVLLNEGHEQLVSRSRVLHPEEDNPIVEFIILLPLNFIPVAGVPLFLVLTGYRAGPFHHWRYFQLLEMTKNQRKEYIRKRRLSYTAFGTVALVLQLVPLFSMFFLLTSAAGSAIWVSEIENAKAHTEEADRQYPEYRDEAA